MNRHFVALGSCRTAHSTGATPGWKAYFISSPLEVTNGVSGRSWGLTRPS